MSKIRITFALAFAGTLASSSAYAVDTSNWGGNICKVESDSPAPASAIDYDFYGRACNASPTQQMILTCPLLKDTASALDFAVWVDYIMNDQDGIHAHDDVNHPYDILQCFAFSHDEYGQAYWWSGWWGPHLIGGNNSGATPHPIVLQVDKSLSGGFNGVRCQIPRKTTDGESCISHLCVDERQESDL